MNRLQFYHRRDSRVAHLAFALVLLMSGLTGRLAFAETWPKLETFVKQCVLIVKAQAVVSEGKEQYRVLDTWKGHFNADQFQPKAPEGHFYANRWHGNKHPVDGQEIVFFFTRDGLSDKGKILRHATAFPVENGKLVYASTNRNLRKKYSSEDFKAAIAKAVADTSKRMDTSVYDVVWEERQLPTGGQFVRHPKKEAIRYYFTNRLLMWPDPSNTRKHSGLYVSTDKGATWRLKCYFFEFQELFVHPQTGILFAIIQYDWLADDDGYLIPHSANKIIVSEDGKRWKDITGGRGYIADLTGIKKDPVHPKRVCVSACVGRDYMLHAVDDQHSEWEWRRITERSQAEH